ncbi:MAG: DUF4129 domain-containing protein [Planctomycetota bacterium]|nr:DUF4129 domain-containing protein [Planctomycetota bacterium]
MTASSTFSTPDSKQETPDVARGVGGRWLLTRLAVVALFVASLIPCPDVLFGLSPVRSAIAQESPDEAAIRQELDEILEHPDFRRLRLKVDPPEVEIPWFKRFYDWLDGLFPTPSGGGRFSWIGDAFRIFGYTVIGILVCGIIWLIVKGVNAWRASRREKLGVSMSFEEGSAELPPGDIPADEYLRRARELSAQGLFGEAIAQLLLGAMSATERSGLIRFRRGLTYRDYVRALRQQPEPRDSFRKMVHIYLPIGFGRRPAASTQFETALAAYEAAFATALIPVPAKPAVVTNPPAPEPAPAEAALEIVVGTLEERR